MQEILVKYKSYQQQSKLWKISRNDVLFANLHI